MPVLLNLLTGKLGGWAVAGLVFILMSGAVYIQGLRVDAAQAALRAERQLTATLQANLSSAVNINERYKKQVDRLTDDLAAAQLKGRQAAALAAAERQRREVQTRNLLREVERAATPEDDRLVSPALRAALAGLRAAFGGAATGGDRGPPGGTVRPAGPAPRALPGS